MRYVVVATIINQWTIFYSTVITPESNRNYDTTYRSVANKQTEPDQQVTEDF
jgi:hypothetical protein